MADETSPQSPLPAEDQEKVAASRKKVREQLQQEADSKSSGRGSGAAGSQKKKSKAAEILVERSPEELERIRKVVDKAFALLDLLGNPKATDAQKDEATSAYARESTILVIEKWLPYVKYAEEINCGFAITMYGGWRGYKFARTLLKGQGAQLSELSKLTDLASRATAALSKPPAAPPAPKETKPPDAPPPAPMTSTIPEEP